MADIGHAALPVQCEAIGDNARGTYPSRDRQGAATDGMSGAVALAGFGWVSRHYEALPGKGRQEYLSRS